MTEINDITRSHSVRRAAIRRIAAAPRTQPGKDVAEIAEEPDAVAVEEPLEIRLGYSRRDGSRAEESLSVTMRTPGNDDELAVGFLFTEGIVRSAAEVRTVVPRGQPAANGLINVVRVELSPDVVVNFERLQRHFYTASSCGVCGKASIDAVAVQGRFDLHGADFALRRDVLGTLAAALEREQTVFEQTGGLHASGVCDATGRIELVREDVGRHNALDKLIGHELMHGRVPLTHRGIVVSGRASFELMQKAMVAGCPLVAAVGAPSSLAIDVAREFGMTLVGFLKPDRFNVYNRADRIV